MSGTTELSAGLAPAIYELGKRAGRRQALREVRAALAEMIGDDPTDSPLPGGRRAALQVVRGGAS